MKTAKEITDIAVERAHAAADDDWKERALTAVELCAIEFHEFTSDDVWLSGLDKPREARAFGGVIRRAAKAGWVEKTDRFRPSAFPESHCGPRQVWRSLVCAKAVA